MKQQPVRAKWSNREMQTPGRKVMPWQEDSSQKIMGLNPGVSKGFSWTINHLIMELGYYTRGSFIMYWLTQVCICGRCTQNLNTDWNKTNYAQTIKWFYLFNLWNNKGTFFMHWKKIIKCPMCFSSNKEFVIMAKEVSKQKLPPKQI